MLLENFIVSKVIFAHQAIFSTLYIGRPDVGHNDERWSELIITCSFIDITNFTYILILYGLSRKKNLTEFFKCILEHTHTRLTALCRGLPGWAGTRKVKPIWILRKQETVSGSGISWAICKSAPCSRQITMPAPHHSDFYRPDALPAAQPTASKQ